MTVLFYNLEFFLLIDDGKLYPCSFIFCLDSSLLIMPNNEYKYEYKGKSIEQKF